MRIPSKLLLAFCTTLGFVSATALVPYEQHPATAATFDYIRNGGFESNVDGWSLFGGDVPEQDPTIARVGNSSARVRINESGQFTLRQSTFGSVDAGLYALHASILVSAGAVVDIEIQVCPGKSCSHGACSLCVARATNRWEDVNATITLDQTDRLTIAIIGLGAAGAVVNIDDVRLDGPPPVTSTPTATATEPLVATDTPPPLATATVAPSNTPTPKATATTEPIVVPPGPDLRNAGFELAATDGGPSDWRRWGGILTSEHDRVHDGTGAARLESTTASTKWLYQIVTVHSGSGYEFGAWIRSDDANTNAAFLRVSWYPSDDGSGASLGANDSTERITAPNASYQWLTTGGIAAPASAHSARLRIMLAPSSAASAIIYADDATWAPAEVLVPRAAVAPAVADNAAASDEAAGVDDTGPGDVNAPTPAQRVLGTSKRPTKTAMGVAAAPAGTHVVINEVFYDPDGSGDSSADEWVELYNDGLQPVALDGWSLADARAATHIAAATIAPDEYLVLAASDSFHTRYPAFAGNVITVGRIGNMLGNDGDRLSLRDATAAVIDAVSWGSDASVLDPAIVDAPAGHSIERSVPGADSDRADDFVDNESPSPGKSISPLDHGNGNSQRQSSSTNSAAPSVVAAGQSFGWLPWTVASFATVALFCALSWRAIPLLTQRLRHHA